jgi:uncharacterized protein (TIGR00369 family)
MDPAPPLPFTLPFTPPFTLPFTLEDARERLGRDSLAAWIGFQLDAVEPGRVAARMTVTPAHIAPTGFLHASVIIALADLACGVGALALLRDPDEKFATLEITTNHLGTARAGLLFCTALARHAGSGTQVWDAEVVAATTNKPIMLFRCAQMLLRPR